MQFKPENQKSNRSSAKKKPPQREGPKPPKKITESYLHNSGLYYLQRYAASSQHFRSVMMRKVHKSCHHHEDQDLETCAQMVDTLVETFLKSGLIDDDTYIEGVIRTERRRGRSHKAITARLMAKSIPLDTILAKLSAHAEEQDHDPEFDAALTFAKRKKFGPYSREKLNTPDDTDEITKTKKILGSFARAGFSYETARRVLDLSPDDVDHFR